MLLGFLLPLCLGFLSFDLLRRLKPSMDLCEIILIEAIILGIAIVVTTELLNALHALTTGVVLLWWSLGCLSVNYYRLRLPLAKPLGFVSRWRDISRKMSWDALGMLLAIAVFSIVLLLVGLFATPNNYDSMTYHLARVAHWRQDQSISFYGTNIPRQNYMPPWAEWVMLQLTLLQGDDQLVNIVQWMSYVGCMIGVYLITGLLGGSRRARIISAFFMATLPGATFEATSTQNDLVMSFWLICTVYGCIKLSLRPSWLGVFIFGASLGLAMLTKTVTMIFALPLCVWAVWALGWHGIRKAVPRLVVIALIAVALNAGHWTRNLVSSGNLFGPEQHDKIVSVNTNDTHSLGAIFSNILRNASLHANLFHKKSTAEQLVIGIHRALGLDPQDPRTTFNEEAYSILDRGEDGTPMPFHLAVIGLSFIALIWNYNRFAFLPLALALSVLVGAFLFCLILKWSPNHSRLHLALFSMSAPFAALVLGDILRRDFYVLVMVLFLLGSMPHVFLSKARPVFGLHSVFVTTSDCQLNYRSPEFFCAYVNARQLLEQANVKEVGLICNGDDWEYPYFNSNRIPVPWRVDDVLIENAYAPLETSRVPDALLCTRSGLDDVLMVHGRRYKVVHTYRIQDPGRDLSLSIYFPECAAFDQSP